MAKRSSTERIGSTSRVKVEEISPQEEEISTVLVVLQRNLNLNYIGKSTGTRYVFNGAGSTVEVDVRDVDEMLKKGANQKSCCSGSSISPYFSLVQEV